MGADMETDKTKILEEHLPYEHRMLEHAYAFLTSDSYTAMREDWFLRNAVINAFWMHARNLIEFYRNAKDVSASASDYTKTRLDPEFRLKKGEPADDNRGEELTDLINAQIVHLKNERVTKIDEKLGSYEPLRVITAIERARRKFEGLLTDEAATIWKYTLADSIIIAGAVSATNHIEIVSSSNMSPTLPNGPQFEPSP